MRPTLDESLVSKLKKDKETIKSKIGLRHFYSSNYTFLKNEIEDINGSKGLIIELGSGAGHIKDFIPDAITTDVFEHPFADKVIDGTCLPFEDESLKAIYLMDVFHHIPDVELFLHEANRCLIPRGKVLIVDQHVGWISKWILKYAHNEHFDKDTKEWSFSSDNPLYSANGALAWIVFQRDIEAYNKKFPGLKLKNYRPVFPFLYWASGGLKSWSFVFSWNLPLINLIDNFLLLLSPNLGSFVQIVLEKGCSQKV